MKKVIRYILVIALIISTVITIEPFGSKLKPVPIEHSDVLED
jgi:hypothetical protein